jgi:hypothetical protein
VWLQKLSPYFFTFTAMKKRSTFIIPFLCLLGIFHACKKTDESPQEVVQKQLLGKWPLKYRISKITTNKFLMRSDTIRYSPVDTLVFAADGSVTRRNINILATDNYQIDAAGESITFGKAGNATQKFTFVGFSTIGFLVSDQTVTVGENVIRTVVEDQLDRQR